MTRKIILWSGEKTTLWLIQETRTSCLEPRMRNSTLCKESVMNYLGIKMALKYLCMLQTICEHYMVKLNVISYKDADNFSEVWAYLSLRPKDFCLLPLQWLLFMCPQLLRMTFIKLSEEFLFIFYIRTKNTRPHSMASFALEYLPYFALSRKITFPSSSNLSVYVSR